MPQLDDFVASHLGAIGLVLFIGCVIVLLLVAMLFVQSRRIALLSGRLDALSAGSEGMNLEEVLTSHLGTVVQVANDLEQVAARTAVLEGASRLHFSRLGLVRFNPFDDTGGNQSFAIALLDANNDGLVISSLHSRTGTRIYAKAVFEGTCESSLSTEEEKAIAIAVAQGAAAATGEAAPAKKAGRGRALKPKVPALAARAPIHAATPELPASEAEETDEAAPAEVDATAPGA